MNCQTKSESKTYFNFRFREELKDKCEIVDSLEDQIEDLRSKERDNFDQQKIREDEFSRKIEQLEERLRDGVGSPPRGGDWGWEEGEVMNMSNDSPAIFGVPNSKPHPANSSEGSNHYNSQVSVCCCKIQLGHNL